MKNKFCIGLCAMTVFISTTNTYTQIKYPPNTNKQKQLYQFAKQKNKQFQVQQYKVDSICDTLHIPKRMEEKTGTVIEMQLFNKHNHPVYYSTHNINAARTINTNKLWTYKLRNQNLNGQGSQAIIFDGGSVLNNHRELVINGISKNTNREFNLNTSRHTTHIVGTMLASGVDTAAHGMAPEANSYVYDFNNDITEMSSEAADGSLLSNHSYGTICGWRHDSGTDTWYWHGDYEVSSYEDANFGAYNELSRDVDFIAFNAPQYLIVKSAGNDRNDNPETQPLSHYIWNDGWELSSDIHALDGGDYGFGCIGPMGASKNVLTVGSTPDLNSTNTTSDFSSWGPTDDGRIKPDIVANGEMVYSCTSDSTNAYLQYSGSSMACASMTGSILLLQQAQQLLQPKTILHNATIKALLIHTTDESGAYPGPDYKAGWGVANIEKAVLFLEKNFQSGGQLLIQDTLKNSTSKTYTVTIPENESQLKATLYWNDPPASADIGMLNNTASKLINDLDITLTNNASSTTFYPWVLNPLTPDDAAQTGNNSRDNTEQIQIENPEANTYVIAIAHKGTLQNNEQAFCLLISGITTSDSLYPPSNLGFSCSEKSISLCFNPPSLNKCSSYNVYRNNTLLSNITDTLYTDTSVKLNSPYLYHVTAIYNGNEESLPTNTVSINLQPSVNLPFYENFESVDHTFNLKNNFCGWRYGNADSLNSYYLNFSANKGHFIGTDSYTAGEGVHTSDIAVSPPLNLINCTDVTISLSHFLRSGVYDAIDEINIVCKREDDDYWTKIGAIEASYSWKRTSYSVPSNAYNNRVLIGIQYDDLYRWGLGAAIDSVAITGSCKNLIYDIAPTKLISPESACTLSDKEQVSVEITNKASDTIPAGTSFQVEIKMNDSLQSESYTLTQVLIPDSSTIIKFDNTWDLSVSGMYNIRIILRLAYDNNILNDTLYTSIENYPVPTPAIQNLANSYCQIDSNYIINCSPSGGLLNSDGMQDSILNPSLLSVGEHNITCTVANDNCTASEEYTFMVYALPDISITNTDTILCENNSPITIHTTPGGGILSGSSVIDSILHPELLAPDTYNIHYTYIDSNKCKSSCSQNFYINELPALTLLSSDTVVCQNELPFPLKSSPCAVFTCDSLPLDSVFVPSIYAPGEHKIYACITDTNGCSTSDSFTVMVNNIPDVRLTCALSTVCQNDTPVYLVEEPVGGYLYGAGLSGSLFYPNEVDSGYYTFIYTYTDEHNCTNNDTLQIHVVKSVNIQFETSDLLTCINEPAVTPQVQPEGGLFWGEGIINNKFYPAVSGLGNFFIKYSFQENCPIDSFQVQVHDFTPVSFLNRDTTFCSNTSALPLSAFPLGGVFSGDGLKDNTFYPQAVFPGDYKIYYRYLNQYQCESSDSIHITLLQAPEPSFTNLNDYYCATNDTITLVASPNGGSFTSPFFTGNCFVPAEMMSNECQVSYIVIQENGCCDSISSEFTINPLPVVNLGLDTTINYNDSIALTPTTNATRFEWFDEWNESERLLLPNDLDVGENSVWLNAWNQHLCFSSDTMVITVLNKVENTQQHLVNAPKIYPNPARHEIYIENEGTIDFINIYSLNGTFICRLNGKANKFSISLLENGLYLLKFPSPFEQHAIKLMVYR